MVRLILRIFHKPNKLVGVVKYTDRVVVKWESDDQANELQVVQVAEASNNARKELGIQEKLVWDWRKKKTTYQEQCDLYSVKILIKFFFTKV